MTYIQELINSKCMLSESQDFLSGIFDCENIRGGCLICLLKGVVELTEG